MRSHWRWRWDTKTLKHLHRFLLNRFQPLLHASGICSVKRRPTQAIRAFRDGTTSGIQLTELGSKDSVFTSDAGLQVCLALSPLSEKLACWDLVSSMGEYSK